LSVITLAIKWRFVGDAGHDRLQHSLEMVELERKFLTQAATFANIFWSSSPASPQNALYSQGITEQVGLKTLIDLMVFG